VFKKTAHLIMTGVARNRGEETSLADIELAVQTELPLVKQHLYDTLWAVRGKRTQAERVNRLTGARAPFIPQPSAAVDLTHAFGGGRGWLPGELGPLQYQRSVVCNAG
jgi:hypothetical protein